MDGWMEDGTARVIANRSIDGEEEKPPKVYLDESGYVLWFASLSFSTNLPPGRVIHPASNFSVSVVVEGEEAKCAMEADFLALKHKSWILRYCWNVQSCAEKRDCFEKHQPGVASCGWLQPGRNFLST